MSSDTQESLSHIDRQRIELLQNSVIEDLDFLRHATTIKSLKRDYVKANTGPTARTRSETYEVPGSSSFSM